MFEREIISKEQLAARCLSQFSPTGKLPANATQQDSHILLVSSVERLLTRPGPIRSASGHSRNGKSGPKEYRSLHQFPATPATVLCSSFSFIFGVFMRTPMMGLWCAIAFVCSLALFACGGGGSSSPSTPVVLNPAPSISSLSPTSVAVAATGSTLTINGSGFMTISVVNWG